MKAVVNILRTVATCCYVVTYIMCSKNSVFAQLKVAEDACGDESACYCYYYSDCYEEWDYRTSYCGFGDCCMAGSGDGKADGMCIASNGFVPIDDVYVLSNALNAWLLAYEQAAIQGGGAPDPTLIKVAQSFDLPVENHAAVRKMAIFIVFMYAGQPHYKNSPHIAGYFTWSSDDPGMENGMISAQTPREVLEAGRITRQAIITELRTLGAKGMYDRIMSQGTTIVPDYTSFGRCQFPHPVEHGHVFPYIDAFDCLKREIQPLVNEVISLIDRTKTGNNNACEIERFEIAPNPFSEMVAVNIAVVIPPCSDNSNNLIIRSVLGNVLVSRPLEPGINVITVNSSEINNNRVCRCEVMIGNKVVASKTMILIK